ncbi:MAG: tRNA (adenine(22)-N(1))-methyltransferase TrmK [Mycoplasmataceae bacterium]|nr:tRNA (adenine(22)-N(1))-methyltransferase TrmK [Mycoplasmataceae bacterium]
MKDNRIDCIINLIKDNGTVVDVGSDHAQLAIKLLIQNKAKHVYNIEINNNPYQNTLCNLKAKNLLNKTTNICANGLKTLDIQETINYCVIAGMGGNKITQILAETNTKLKIKKFILLPNNSADSLRFFLRKMKYKLFFEKIIQEKKYYYQLIVASKNSGLSINNSREIYFGSYNLRHPSKLFNQMNETRLQYIEKNKLYIHNHKIKQEWKLLKEERQKNYENYSNR